MSKQDDANNYVRFNLEHEFEQLNLDVFELKFYLIFSLFLMVSVASLGV